MDQDGLAILDELQAILGRDLFAIFCGLWKGFGTGQQLVLKVLKILENDKLGFGRGSQSPSD